MTDKPLDMPREEQEKALAACIKALYAVMTGKRCWCENFYQPVELQHQHKCQAATNAIVAAERVLALSTPSPVSPQKEKAEATHEQRANAMRDEMCRALSATGAYPHEVPAILKAALEADNHHLDAIAALRASAPRPPLAPTETEASRVLDRLEAHAQKYLAGSDYFHFKEVLDWAREDFAASPAEASSLPPTAQEVPLPKLTGNELRKGTGDVLKDLAHAQRFTDSLQDQFGGSTGLDLDFIDRALRVAMGEIKNLRNTIAEHKKRARPSAAPVSDPDNHHNALTCPYCNPHGLKFAAPVSEPPDGYCRWCEGLTHLTTGDRCATCRSNDTRRLTDAERQRLSAAPVSEPESSEGWPCKRCAKLILAAEVEARRNRTQQFEAAPVSLGPLFVRDVARLVGLTDDASMDDVYSQLHIALRPSAAPVSEAPDELRDLLVRADSYLSLLWHRFVPSVHKDSELTMAVERTIGDLRRAYEHNSSR